MLIRILFFIVFPIAGFSQNTIGLPEVINYLKGQYRAGLQNWDIRQDKNGIIYIANNEGLLSFDGRNWNLYPLPNKTIVRSVEIGPDNRIYVGGQDEMGYFAPDNQGRLVYHSITKLIPAKNSSFGDVWDIIVLKNDIFFRSLNKIFRLSKDSISTYNAPLEWGFLGICHGKLYAQDFKAGLLHFINNNWEPIPQKSDYPANDPVTSILELPGDSAVITSLKNGVYLLTEQSVSKLRWQTSAIFEKERIYAATAISNEWIALATNNGGVYITDISGNIIQRFSRTEGLQHNNVLSIFLDSHQNLWLGLDNGVDFIAYNSAIKHITPQLQDGSGYTAIIHNNQLYAGTSGGLFSVPLQKLRDLSFSKGAFLPVPGTTGQAWNLSEINNQLLLGHHDGAFSIKDNKASPVSTQTGFWNFIPLSSATPVPQIVAGNYKGLRLFDYRNGQFSQSGEIPDFIESSRFVAIDMFNNIWVSHPYHGVYKINNMNNGRYNTEIYTDKKGLPSTLNNHIFKIKNEVFVATERGVYVYDNKKDIFTQSPFYKKLLGDIGIRYLKEDKAGNIWFINQKRMGVVDMSGMEPSVIFLPELNNRMLSGFEFIYPVDENNVFLGAEKGFYHINFGKYKKTKAELQVQVRMVRIINNIDSLLFGGYFSDVNEKQQQDAKKIPSVSYSWKTIRFGYSSAFFNDQETLEYSYRLKGFEENWSEWTRRTEKEYTNLPAGNYTFEVKVRNNLGNESAVSGYSFRILAPWYQTGIAYTIYLLCISALMIAVYRWQKKKFLLQQIKHEEEQKKLSYIHELEINKTENELVAVRNEKLEADINYKNSELASSAMHLVKKGELLTNIKSELTQLMKRLDNEKVVSEIKKIIKTLSDDDNIDKEWENFAKHFDQVHSDFVVKLKEKHPAISGNELKLCAYLRMNLSTKEIAQLMNISVRGVEISRYRLRKKLGIPTEVSLFDYLIKLG